MLPSLSAMSMAPTKQGRKSARPCMPQHGRACPSVPRACMHAHARPRMGTGTARARARARARPCMPVHACIPMHARARAACMPMHAPARPMHAPARPCMPQHARASFADDFHFCLWNRHFVHYIWGPPTPRSKNFCTGIAQTPSALKVFGYPRPKISHLPQTPSALKVLGVMQQDRAARPPRGGRR